MKNILAYGSIGFGLVTLGVSIGIMMAKKAYKEDLI